MNTNRFLLTVMVFWQFGPVLSADEAIPPDRGAGHVVGPIPDGQLVGLVGRGHRIRFEGNTIFTDRELRVGLAQSSSLMMASRPSELMDAFLEKLGERLESGYRFSGCPDAKVRVFHQPENRDQPILVRIEEGERYRQGEIIVRGAEGIDRQALIDALSRGNRWTLEQRMLKRIRDAAKEDSERLPKPVGMGIEPLEQWNDDDEARWVPGEPVRFKQPGGQPLTLDVMFFLAEQGRAHARFETSHERRPDGLADLVIDITDPGPAPIIGQIIIDGAKRFGRDEILRVVGLENGQVVRPRDLEKALLGLWRSGRFYPFEIDAHPRGPGMAEIDFRIRLQEIDGMPALDEPLSPTQTAVNKGIDWVNRQMGGDEVLITFDEPLSNGLTMEIGWSSADGLLLDVQNPERDQGMTLRYSNQGVDLLVRDGDRRMAGAVPVRLKNNKIRLLPTGEEKPFEVSMATGFVLADEGGTQDIDVGLLVSPSVPLLKEDKFELKGDQVVVQEGLLTLDLESGMPVGIAGGTVTIQAGCVKDRLEKLAREMAGADEMGVDASKWREVVSTILGGILPEGLAQAMEAEKLKWFRDLGRLDGLLGGSHVKGALVELTGLLTAGDDAEAFEVPGGLDDLTQAGMASLLFETGLLAAIDETFPDADWPSVFCRELLLLLLTDDDGAGRNLSAVLADPAIGPVGCLVCAKLLEKQAPGMSQEFLRTARDQSGVGGFRSDWRMLLSTRSVLKKQMVDLWEGLRTLTPEKEAELAKILGGQSEPILKNLLETLRRDGASPPTEELLAPTMDRLWEDHLGGWTEDYLEKRILPPVDPREMAATINGAPVPRFLLRKFREGNWGSMDPLVVSKPDPERAWTQDPELAVAVRVAMLIEHLRKGDRLPPDEKVAGVLEQLHPDLNGKPDADWVRKTGLTREQLGYWTLCNVMLGQVVSSISEDVAEPDEETLKEHFQSHPDLFQSKLSLDTVYVELGASNPVEFGRAYRLAKAVAALGGDGLSLGLIGQLAEMDEEPGFRVFSRKDEKADMFQVGLLRVIRGVGPGETSQTFLMGNGVAAVRLNARERDPSIQLAEVKGIAREHWKASEADRIGEQFFSKLEQGVVVEVLEDPDPAEAGGLTALQQLKLAQPESVLSSFLDAWQQLASEDEAEQDETIEWLFGPNKGADPTIVKIIAKGHLELVGAYLKRAAEVNREKTDGLTSRLAQNHAEHGEGCTVHPSLERLREEVFGKGKRPGE